MGIIDAGNFGKGAKREKFKLNHLLRGRLDTHLKYHKPLTAGTPLNILAIAKLFPVKNQGQSGSCGGQGWAHYGEVLKYIRDGQIVPLSAKDIYSHAFTAPEGSDEGHLIGQVANNGIAYESEVPSYENGQPPSEKFMEMMQLRPTDNAYDQVAIKPLTFNGNDIEQVKQAIDVGNGAVVALEGNNACWTTNNGLVQVPNPAQVTWGHWLYLVAYDDMEKIVTAKNSWGDKAGDKGYFYIPYGYFASGIVYGEWTFSLTQVGEYVSLLEKVENLLKNIIEKIKK